MKLEHRTVVNHYSKDISKTENILIVMHQINEERAQRTIEFFDISQREIKSFKQSFHSIQLHSRFLNNLSTKFSKCFVW